MDGFHRFHAARQADKREIECNIIEGTLRDAILAAAGANACHGLHRSKADKRRSVLALLQDDEWSQLGNAEIARRTRTSRSFVALLRRELREQQKALEEQEETA